MTNSFLPDNSFQAQANPVDTFVTPSTVAPTTGFDHFVNALVAVNPSIQNYLDVQIKEEIKEEQVEGIEIANKEFRNLVKTVKEKDGNDLANQLIGGSIWSDNAYQKQKALILGTQSYENLFGLYQGKTFEIEVPDGKGGVKLITKPIHHFDVTSPQFQSLLSDFSLADENNLQGIKTKYHGTYYQSQAQAIEEITKHHIKKNSEYKVERQKGFLDSTLFSSWLEFDSGNIEGALGTTQEYIETTVNLGLSEAVTADKMWEVAKIQASRIFQITEQNGGNGYEAVEKYLEFISQIKYGPQELQKDGSLKQRTIGESMAYEMLEFRVKLGDQSDKLLTRQLAKVKAAEDFTIETMTKKYATDNTVLERLLEIFPHRREFLFDKIEIHSGNRDELFEDFNYKVGTGFYQNNRDQMFTDLRAIKAQIGDTFTQEDEDNYNKSFEIARRSVSSNVGNYPNRTERMFKQGRSLLGNEGIDLNTYTDKTFIAPHIDLMRRTERRVIDEITNVPGLSEKDRERIFREIEQDYFNSLKQITAGTYVPPGIQVDNTGDDNTGNKTEAEIRKDGIQKIADQYGFSAQIAEEIYDYVQQDPDSELIINDVNITNLLKGNEGEKIENNLNKENINVTRTKGTANDPHIIDDVKSLELLLKNETITNVENVEEGDRSWIDLAINESGKANNNNQEIEGIWVDKKGEFYKLKPGILMPSLMTDTSDIANYVVEEGDTLTSLAEGFSTTVQEIMEANNLTDENFIQIGRKLKIPMNTIEESSEKDNLNIYTVKEGDNLSDIAKANNIELENLLEANNIEDPNKLKIGQKIIIPERKPQFLDQYKGKVIPDFGGLAKLIISGESMGHGSYNAFNKQSKDGKITPGTMDITSKTIAEMEQLQDSGEVFAVGAYQFTPGVLAEAREYAGIEADEIMTPAVQDRLFWGMLLSGEKKAAITDYLLGESDDLRAAHEALAKEFAALEGPDGVGIYDGDGNNLATIKAAKVKETLIKARKAISNK